MTPPSHVVFAGGPLDNDYSKDIEAANDSNHTRQSKQLERQLSSNGRADLLLDDQLDGPWQRAKDEWKDPYSWFGMDDQGRLLDVPSTFGGTQTIYKWLLWAWMISTAIYLWHSSDSAWFLGRLDHWALIASLLYQTLSLGNGHFTPPQPAVASEGVNTYLKVFWLVFEIAAHLQLLVTLLFWTIVFPTNDLPIGYDTFALHGLGLVAVWVDGMVLNRIPVRIKHYFIVLNVDAVYCIWTIIHAAAGLDNGVAVSDTGLDVPEESDAIYLAVDWHDETVQAAFLMFFILTVVAPLCFMAQYCFSLYSFPWTWNGSKSRKVIDFDTNRGAATGRSTRHQPPSPTNKKSTVDLPKAGGNISETSRTSSQQDNKRRSSLPVVRPTSPAPPRRSSSPVKKSTRKSSTPVRPTSPPPRPASPVKKSTKRASTKAPVRASTATTPRKSATNPRKSTKTAPAPKKTQSSTKKKPTKKSKKKLPPMDIA